MKKFRYEDVEVPEGLVENSGRALNALYQEKLIQRVADITITADDLYELVTLKCLSDGLMRRIKKNYKRIVGVNTALIGLGVTGVIQPTTSALLHNTTTLAISVGSMKNLLT